MACENEKQTRDWGSRPRALSNLFACLKLIAPPGARRKALVTADGSAPGRAAPFAATRATQLGTRCGEAWTMILNIPSC